MDSKAREKRIFLAVLLIAAFLLTARISGCGIRTYDFEGDQEIFFLEPMSAANDNACLIKGRKVEWETAVFFIDRSYTVDRQDRFLTFAEDVLNELKPVDLITYYVGKDFANRTSAVEHAVYLNSMDEVNFVHHTLQVMGDPRLNYGLLYGLSVKIAGKYRKVNLPHIGNEKLKQLLSSEEFVELLDLTAPVFFSPHTSEEQSNFAKAISVSLTDYWFRRDGGLAIRTLLQLDLDSMEADENEQALFADYQEQFAQLRNLYLADCLGLSLTVTPSPVLVRYSTYTTRYPISIETDWGLIHIKKDFENLYMKDEASAARWGDLRYASLKNNLQAMDLDLRAMLADYGLTMQALLPKYTVLVDEQYLENGYSGRCIAEKRTIELSSLMLFDHEYNHAIVDSFFSYFSYRWMGEGIASFYEDRSASKRDYNDAEIAYFKNAEETREIYGKIRPYVSSDDRAVQDVLAYQSIKLGNTASFYYSSYYRYASFVYYLVDRYSLASVLTAQKDMTQFHDIFGETQLELWQDWLNELFARFEEVPPSEILYRII